MKTLYLLRHAKSSWEDHALADFDRPLSGRGREACARMGRYMAAELAPADRVICSAARRTRETWERLAPSLSWKASPLFEPGIYNASAGALLARLQAAEPESSRLLLIGHNPAMQELSLLLTVPDQSGEREHLAQKYPTGALAVIAFDAVAWRDIDARSGRLVGFVRPRDLDG